MTDDIEAEIERDMTQPLWLAFQAGAQVGSGTPLVLAGLDNELVQEELQDLFKQFLVEYEDELEPYFRRRGATFKLQKAFEMWVDAKENVDGDDQE